MGRQTSFVVGGLLAVALLALLAFGAGWGSFYVLERSNIPIVRDIVGLSPATAAQQGREAVDDELPLFWEAMGLLEEHYYDPETLPSGNESTYAAIEGVIAATGDPHTGFMDPERTEIVETDLAGEFEGIGATVEMSDEGLVIVSPFPGTPAEEAGLLPGDLVVRVDGTPTQGMTVEEAVALVRGPEGTVVELTISRGGSAELMDIPVTRGKIVVPIIETKLLTPEGIAPIGYIRLNDFGGRSVEQFNSGLQELRSQGAERFIVDLRNNPGGFLQAAVTITSQFVGEGVILSERGTDRDLEYMAEEGGIALDVPLVVLINEGSASASEIFAGAVRDHDRGTLIGETTFGKGSVQITRNLSDGSSMRITVARWFTPDGEAIHEVGIPPDIEVPYNPIVQAYLPDVGLAVETTDEGLLVTRIYPNTPIAESELQEGDLITEVDRLTTAGIAPSRVTQIGSGPTGSEARLTVERDGETLDLLVQRSYPETFSEGDPQLEAAIDYLRAQP